MMNKEISRTSKLPQGKTAARPGITLTLAVASLLAAVAPSAMAEGAKGSTAHIAAVTKKVDGAFMRANEAKTADWPSTGLDYAEPRFSKLDQVNASNVKDMGLVWSYNL
jgi:quinohemoprotein ethanol dehydrogenase